MKKTARWTLMTVALFLILMALMAIPTIDGPGAGLILRCEEIDARIKMMDLETALVLYALDHEEYPAENLGLKALIISPGSSNWHGPYLQDTNNLVDSWNHPFKYTRAGKGFIISSAGPDGESGTKDDLHEVRR